jgi:DNA repair protein SbcC/Rad50
MFSRFFKPRWQHTDAAVRQKAVAELNPTQEADRDVLATLAKGDASAAVRAAAAARLTDLKLLDQLIQRDADNAVREAAERQVEALLAGTAAHAPSQENRLRIIALTQNPRVLASVARSANDSPSRLAAVNRLEDQAALAQLATDGIDAELRLAAATRLEDKEALRRLVRDGRDKRVVRLARERLKQHQQQDQQTQQHQQRGDELIASLSAHATRQFDGLYQARLQQLRQSWNDIAADTRTDQRTTAEALLDQCQNRVDEWHAAQQQQALKETARTEQQATLATLQESLDGLTDAEEWQPANSLTAFLGSQQRRWQAASEQYAPDPAQAAQFAELEQRWLALIDAWRTADLSEQTPDWPTGLPLPPALRQAMTQAAVAANVDTNTTPAAAPQPAPELDRTLGVLHSALRQRQLKLANRLWHRIEAQLDDAKATYVARAEKLKAQLDELRDWHAFAAEPKKQQLCEQMEQLIEQDLPAQEKADAIQLLHDQWKTLMSADQQSDQALWERFRSASDTAWAPCREHFAELDRERAANLAKRIALCDQLEQYLQQLTAEQSIDWAAVAIIRRQAPQEWKGYQPVRFTDLREANKRFSALLKQFDELLDTVGAQRIAQLEALITQAEALATSEDSRQATQEFKALQKRWQDTGWAPATAQRKLYKRFRTLADQVFARRQEEQQAQQQQFTEQANALRRALAELEQQLNEAKDDASMKQLGDMVEQIAALPCPHREEKLQHQRDTLLRQAKARRQHWPQWQRWDNLRQRIAQSPVAADHPEQQTLAVALEVSAGIDSPDHAKEHRMQWQLQQLTTAMKGSSAPSQEHCRELLEQSTVLEQGLSDDIRARILRVWASLEPRA